MKRLSILVLWALLGYGWAFAAEAAGKEPIDLVEAPDKVAFELAQDLTSEKPFEVDVRAAPPIPYRVGQDREIELIGEEPGQREVK